MNAEKKSTFFDFTPDPKVLIALSHTSMSPMDALCELIDNAIDSFSVAKIQGISINQPEVLVDLPKKSEIDKGIGVLRVRDNGPGMTAEQAEKAIKAGYSGNNSFDSLGLFGMGFNISTSKFGRVTRFMTARPTDEFFTSTVIDLETINQTKSYQLKAERIEKPEAFPQGTIIEISEWWPDGNANNGFVKKLVQYGLPKIRQELGRRYATILRQKEICILVNGVACEAFEHCVWGSNRYVERNGKKIPARFDIDEVVGAKRRCSACRTIIPEGVAECPSCHSTSIRTVEERVHGWVGIQRFDDSTKFGIDLIRNGRAIRLGEKAAFFEYVDDLKNVIKDYPIDGPYGRIVGEVHLDFVPVDFLKQDFQRSSDEWVKAMRVLRGESSLQPKQPGADSNSSYIFKLFQGYRKVRECGKTDLYMGFWDPVERKPKRISRDVEKEYYERFLKHEVGYYDDAEWYKKVEEANQQPIEQLIECPDCFTQNLKEAEICVGCGKILKGKVCINDSCKNLLPESAVICDVCGTSQVPEVSVPWTCNVCGASNNADAVICSECGKPKGAVNPLSEEYLLTVSNKDDALSVDALSITLANGEESSKLELETYLTQEEMVSLKTAYRIPVLTFKSISSFRIFIDPTHPLFAGCNVTMEEFIASEVASFLFDTNRNLAKYPEHTISNLTWMILNKYWMEKIEVSYTRMKDACSALLNTIKEKLAYSIDSDDASLLYEELSKDQQKEFAANLFENNISLDKVSELISSAQFMLYVPSDFVLKVYDSLPEVFFNGKVWDAVYNVENPNINAEILKSTYEQILLEYKNSLETVVLFSLYPSKDNLTMRKVEAAVRFLENHLEE